MVLTDCLLWEDNDFLVIDKPSGISTLSDRKDSVHVLSIIRSKYPEATVAHRLDKDTSGVLVVAKTAEGYRHLSLQFEGRTVEKVYHAVVDGKPAYSGETVDAPIEKLPDGTVRISRRGKPSLTVFNTLEPFRQHALVEARPQTGRTHQIRVHMKHIGHTLFGDFEYGGDKVLKGTTFTKYKQFVQNCLDLLPRQALHISAQDPSAETGARLPRPQKATPSPQVPTCLFSIVRIHQ